MADQPAQQLLDDVFFDQHRAAGTGEIGEQGGEAVIHVRMDQDFDRLGGGQRNGLHRLGRHLGVVVPMRLAEGKELPEIADGRRAGGQGQAGVLEAGRGADDEVAVMGRGGRGAGQAQQVVLILQDQARAARHIGPHRGGITHAPVQADAIAVDPVARFVDLVPYFGIGALALAGIAEADLGMHHYPPLGPAAPFVFRFRFDAVMLEKGRFSHRMRRGRLAAFRNQFGRIGQFRFGKDAFAGQGCGHRSSLSSLLVSIAEGILASPKARAQSQTGRGETVALHGSRIRMTEPRAEDTGYGEFQQMPGLNRPRRGKRDGQIGRSCPCRMARQFPPHRRRRGNTAPGIAHPGR